MQHYSTNAPNAASEIFDGELVIAHYGSGYYYSISRSGALIWQGLRHGLSDVDVSEWLSSHFKDNLDLAVIVSSFIDELRDEGLIVPITQRESGMPLPELHDTTFESPRLERFGDLQDLLLADPVHDVDSTGWPRRASDNVS